MACFSLMSRVSTGLSLPIVAVQDAATTDSVRPAASMVSCRCGIQLDRGRPLMLLLLLSATVMPRWS